MPDKRFFKCAGPFTLAELATLTQARLHESAGDGGEVVLKDVAPLSTAKAGDLSFFDNKKYKQDFKDTKASACFVREEYVEYAPAGMNVLITAQPYKAYALAAQAFYPDQIPEPHIAKSAVIDETATLGDGCVVGENVCIGAHVTIGNHCWIEANSVIGAYVDIGDYCRIGVGVSISHSMIAHHVRIYTGARIGQDGFGFAIDPAGFVKVPQLGRVRIEPYVEIGANTTIDRGSGPDTVIGQGTWIDNLVQIGHNVQIGRGCALAAQVGISGSTVIEDYVSMGGQSGTAGHLTVGTGTQVGGQTGIISSVEGGQKLMGTPALPLRQFMRHIATLNRLIKNNKGS